MAVTRREVLYQIAAAPLAAAQQRPSHPAHPSASAAKPAGPHQLRYLTGHEFQTLRVLSDWIIPPDERSAGGIAAGTAEFIDVMAAGDPELQTRFSGGVAWLDAEMRRRHGKPFRECTLDQQKGILDQLAYRNRVPEGMDPGADFFALMRAWTVDAFYSSREGVKDLGYAGNTAVPEFNGCPDAVVRQLLEKSPL